MNEGKRCPCSLKLSRKHTAPLSVTLLIIVAALAFLNSLRSSSIGPPPILDPNFELWVEDSGTKRLKVWEFEYVKGPSDSVSLQQTVVNGNNATEFLVLQDGKDENWVYAYLKQVIDGTRLRALFTRVLNVSILRESCACGNPSADESTIFGLEVNDGVHTLTFVFSGKPEGFLAHRTVFLYTPPQEWTYHQIDLRKEYDAAHWNWNLTDRLTFSVVFAVAGNATGWHRAYVQGFSSPKPQMNSGVQALLRIDEPGFLLNSAGGRSRESSLSSLRSFSSQ